MPKFILHFTKCEKVLLSADLVVEAKSLAAAIKKGEKIARDQDDELLEEHWQESDSSNEEGFEFETAGPA